MLGRDNEYETPVINRWKLRIFIDEVNEPNFNAVFLADHELKDI